MEWRLGLQLKWSWWMYLPMAEFLWSRLCPGVPSWHPAALDTFERLRVIYDSLPLTAKRRGIQALALTDHDQTMWHISQLDGAVSPETLRSAGNRLTELMVDAAILSKRHESHVSGVPTRETDSLHEISAAVRSARVAALEAAGQGSHESEQKHRKNERKGRAGQKKRRKNERKHRGEQKTGRGDEKQNTGERHGDQTLEVDDATMAGFAMSPDGVMRGLIDGMRGYLNREGYFIADV